MVIEKHVFRSRDFVAGHPALDLVNTVTGRNATPRDWLDGYAALIDWARLGDHFRSANLTTLSRMAAAQPTRAAVALDDIKRLREALCRSIYAIVRGEGFDPRDRAAIEHAHRAAMQAASFEWSREGCRITWTPSASGLELIKHVVVVEALRLLADLDRDRLRICPGDNCGWVFLDSSRNGHRRWCDMATCGNVAKARRHYARTRTG